MQVIERLNKDEAKGLPFSFEQNKVKWASILLKSNQMQVVFSKFTDAVSRVLETELLHNSQLVKDYLKYPHQHH